MLGTTKLIQYLIISPASIRSALGALRRLASGATVASLREFGHHGCLRIDTPDPTALPGKPRAGKPRKEPAGNEHDDPYQAMALSTIIYVDGGVTTRATPAGLAHADEHREAVARALADLTPLPTLLTNLFPLIFPIWLLAYVGKLVFGEGLNHDDWHLLLVRDLLISSGLWAGVLWLIGLAGTLLLRHLVNRV